MQTRWPLSLLGLRRSGLSDLWVEEMTGRMDRVKAALRSAPELCSLSDLYGDFLSNGRNDISTLKRRGWQIDAWWTTHGRDAHKHYALRFDPDRPATKQMSWVAA